MGSLGLSSEAFQLKTIGALFFIICLLRLDLGSSIVKAADPCLDLIILRQK